MDNLSSDYFSEIQSFAKFCILGCRDIDNFILFHGTIYPESVIWVFDMVFGVPKADHGQMGRDERRSLVVKRWERFVNKKRGL